MSLPIQSAENIQYNNITLPPIEKEVKVINPSANDSQNTQIRVSQTSLSQTPKQQDLQIKTITIAEFPNKYSNREIDQVKSPTENFEKDEMEESIIQAQVFQKKEVALWKRGIQGIIEH